MHVGGSSPVDSDDDPLIAPSIPVTIPASGMLPTWMDPRESSEEGGHFGGGHVSMERESGEGFGEPPLCLHKSSRLLNVGFKDTSGEELA